MFKDYDRSLLISDARRKLPKKPLGRGARKKRQKSYGELNDHPSTMLHMRQGRRRRLPDVHQESTAGRGPETGPRRSGTAALLLPPHDRGARGPVDEVIPLG